jgi:hypothetical protein
MAAIRRLAAGAVALALLLGLTACSRHPRVPLPDPPAPVPTRLDGTLYFLGGGGEEAEIWGLAGGSRFRLARDTDYQTVTVSPDGTRYAWIADGRLHLASFAEPADDPVAIGPANLDGAFTPQWWDAGSLIVRYDVTSYGRVDLASGDMAPLPEVPAPYAAFSVGGGFSIYGNATRAEWTVVGGDSSGGSGRAQSSSPVVAPPFRQYSRFQSLAPDGRHVVALLRGFAEPPPDDTRTLAANAIVDVITGSVARLPGAGTVRQGFFRPDGGAVLRVSEGLADRVLLVAASGEVSDRVDLPAEVSTLSLLGYLPAAAPASPSPTSSPTPEPTPTEPPVVLDGTLFLLGDDGSLHTLAGDALDEVAPGGSAFARTVAVSPDGTDYAWISGSRLRVAPVGGSASPVGPSTLDSSFTPVWTADGVIVRYETSRYGVLDPSAGTITPLPQAEEPYVAFSPDGAFAVTSSAGGTPSVVHVEGEPLPAAVIAPEGQRIVSFTSLSPDGHHALVHVIPADAAPPAPTVRPLTATAVVDLATGAEWPVPGGGTVAEGFFQPDGSLVVRVGDEVLLLSRTGSLLDRRALPAGAADLSLLAYAS